MKIHLLIPINLQKAGKKDRKKMLNFFFDVSYDIA